MDNDETKKELIRKYINKNCTPDELLKVKKLLESPGIDILFDEVLSETLTTFEPEKNIDQPHLNTQLDKFYDTYNLQRPGIEKPDEKPVQGRVYKMRKYLSYAAVWAVIVSGVIAYGIWHFDTPAQAPKVAMREVFNDFGKRSKIILPDSSEVYLGSGSKLVIPESFTGNTRTVSLQGEAFFQVTKNPGKPFIIRTGTVQTRVLGTSFKIEAFADKALEVAVVTGKVRVDQFAGGRSTSLAVLTPGQKMTYANGRSVVNEIPIADVSGWQNGKLVFKNKKMSEITDVLQRWYNVKFEYKNPAKADERISITLQGGIPLSRIMKVLSVTGHFTYAINGKTVSIN